MSEIVRKTKPRYHFAAGGGHPPKFWEREPFVWDDDNGRVSRFVSLGAFGGEQGPGKKPRVSANTVPCWLRGSSGVSVCVVVLCILDCAALGDQ